MAASWGARMVEQMVVQWAVTTEYCLVGMLAVYLAARKVDNWAVSTAESLAGLMDATSAD